MQTVALTEVLRSLESGSRPSGGAAGLTSGIPSLGGEHIGPDGRPRLAKMKYVPEKHYSAMKSGRIHRGDILVVKDGATTGKTAFVDSEFPYDHAAVNEHVFIVRCDPSKVDPRFVFHWLRSPDGNAQVLSDFRGSAQGGITRAFASAVQLPALPLDRQRYVATVLDEFDTIRRLRDEANRKTARMLSAYFTSMFGDPETNPNGWPCAPLSDLLVGIDTGWSPKCEDRPVQQGEWGVLKLGAVTWNWFDETANKTLPSTVEPRVELQVKVGDVLLSRKNTRELVGASVLVDRVSENLMFPDLVFRLRPSSRVLGPFLWAALQTPRTRAQIRERAGGSAASMCNVSQGRLREVEVMVPPLERQTEYAAVAGEVMRIRRQQEAAVSDLTAAHAVLRSQLFAS